MTKREVFEKVKVHLLKQGERSYKKGVGCAYRGDGGSMCAVGCLIADEHYSAGLEQLAVFNGKVQEALEASGVTMTWEALRLLEQLQEIHDHYSPENWSRQLDMLEKRVFS